MTANLVAQYPQTAGALTLISEQVLAAPAATVSLASIPQTYKHLKLVVSSQGTNISAGNLQIQFNGDTGSNYYTQFLYNSSNTTAAAAAVSASTSALLGNIAGSASTGPSTLDATIFAYTNALNKVFTGLNMSGVTSITLVTATGAWVSTAAITSLVVSASIGNFATGSIFTLYGMQ